MKISFISDLHIDKGEYSLNINKDVDLIILGGDLCSVTRKELITGFLDKLPTNIPIIYILGNHEYLFFDTNKVIEELKSICKDYKNVNVLDNEVYIFNDVRIIASTLWSDFLGNGEGKKQGNIESYSVHCDIKNNFHIENDEKKISGIDWIIDRCNESKIFLEEELKKSFDGKTIVLTHFAPFTNRYEELSKDYEYFGYWINDFKYLLKYNPEIWLHGHVHQTEIYKIENTMVYCNPRGNIQNKSNDEYDHNFIFEIN